MDAVSAQAFYKERIDRWRQEWQLACSCFSPPDLRAEKHGYECSRCACKARRVTHGS